MNDNLENEEPDGTPTDGDFSRLLKCALAARDAPNQLERQLQATLLMHDVIIVFARCSPTTKERTCQP